MKKILFFISIIMCYYTQAMEQQIQTNQTVTIYEVPLKDNYGKPTIRASLFLSQRQEASLYYYNSPSVLKNYHPSIWGDHKDKLDKVILMQDLSGRFIGQNRTNPMTTLDCKLILIQRICKKLFQEDLKERIVFYPSYGADTSIIERCGFKKIEGMIFFVLTKENRVEVIEEK